MCCVARVSQSIGKATETTTGRNIYIQHVFFLIKLDPSGEIVQAAQSTKKVNQLSLVDPSQGFGPLLLGMREVRHGGHRRCQMFGGATQLWTRTTPSSWTRVYGIIVMG